MRFVRHPTLAESFQHAGRVRRGSHRRTAAAGADVADYDYPTTSNRLESATVGDVAYEFSHDTSGHVTTYDAATGDDRFVAWNARGLAARIGGSVVHVGTTTPAADDDGGVTVDQGGYQSETHTHWYEYPVTAARTVQVPVDDGVADEPADWGAWRLRRPTWAGRFSFRATTWCAATSRSASGPTGLGEEWKSSRPQPASGTSPARS